MEWIGVNALPDGVNNCWDSPQNPEHAMAGDIIDIALGIGVGIIIVFLSSFTHLINASQPKIWKIWILSKQLP